MNKYIALLRGINVGGHNKIPMAMLRNLFIHLGFEKVQTYIQSGNVVFQSRNKTISEIENRIQKGIFNEFEFEVSVIVKTSKELKIIFEASPFSEEKIRKSYFIFFNKTPNSYLLQELNTLIFEKEEVILINDALYFYSEDGYGKAKFNLKSYERKLKVLGTARNYNTMVKLLSLCSEI